MAYASVIFVESSLHMFDEDVDLYEYSYVHSNLTGLPYFALRVKIDQTKTHDMFEEILKQKPHIYY